MVVGATKRASNTGRKAISDQSKLLERIGDISEVLSSMKDKSPTELLPELWFQGGCDVFQQSWVCGTADVQRLHLHGQNVKQDPNDAVEK